MLIDKFQANGINLSVKGDILVFDSSEPITNEQLDTLKSNKPLLIAEILMTAMVEVVDGDIFPLHRFKGTHMPKPISTDFPWLHEMLGHTSNRVEIAAEYSRIYKQEFDTELQEHRKDGIARFAANSWLRTYIYN